MSSPQDTPTDAASGEERAEMVMQLRVGGAQASIKFGVPTRAMTMVELLPVLQGFDNAIIKLAEADAAAQGKTISCKAGCGACCRQLVPISEPEARHVAQVVEDLPEPRRTEIVGRFNAALARLEETGMLAKAAALPTSTDKRFNSDTGLEYFRMGIACPFLEDESCSIHPDRPLSCREFLVTSPAENCQRPDALPTAHLRLPWQLSHVVYESRDGEPAPPRWMPLVTALRWNEEHGSEPQGRAPGPELLQRHLARMKPAQEQAGG